MDINAYFDQPTSQRQQTMNLRSYRRNIPSAKLQPYLDARPVLTKYSILPIIDQRKQIETPLIQQPTFTPETLFNPGNDFGPWSGYASNVNHESELRNQIFALQNCSQTVYVPSSKSDLYNYGFTPKPTPQSHSLLFEKDSFSQFNPNPDSKTVGAGMFFNSTRVQVKDMTKQSC